MTIAFLGSKAPAVGFDLPLEMLEACHRRVERQCSTLRRLVPHLVAHGADAQARDAAQALMRYFDTAAPHHHADEEEDLFPALLESMAGSDAVCLREMIQGLSDQHRELERRWSGLRRELVRVASGQPSALSLDDVEAFVALYERHIAREESELLPMARRLLGDAEIDRIGRAMLDRRGLSGEADSTQPAATR